MALGTKDFVPFLFDIGDRPDESCKCERLVMQPVLLVIRSGVRVAEGLASVDWNVIHVRLPEPFKQVRQACVLRLAWTQPCAGLVSQEDGIWAIALDQSIGLIKLWDDRVWGHILQLRNGFLRHLVP